MNRNQLVEQIKKKKSFLCIGLDPDKSVIDHSFDLWIYDFNCSIIEATHQYAVAYKLNSAFYESQGKSGIEQMYSTLEFLKNNYPEILVIADAKRGDIGNSSKQYADAFFGSQHLFTFDAVTVSPYMGKDSLEPFLKFKNKWTIILILTSNSGASDIQMIRLNNEKFLYEEVLENAVKWGNSENTMFVVGATRTQHLLNVRQIAPKHFLLVPGVGSQGGNLYEVANYGFTSDCGLLVNVSRSVLYSKKGKIDFTFSQHEAFTLQVEMEKLLKQFNII